MVWYVSHVCAVLCRAISRVVVMTLRNMVMRKGDLPGLVAAPTNFVNTFLDLIQVGPPPGCEPLCTPPCTVQGKGGKGEGRKGEGGGGRRDEPVSLVVIRSVATRACRLPP